MTRKITNYLIEGLPAKIYLYCYLEPQTAYTAAIRLYRKPMYSTIYRWMLIMARDGFLEKIDHGYSVKMPPLVKEINEVFKLLGLDLDKFERELLLRILLSARIKKQVRKLSEQNKYTDILSIMCKALSQMASSILEARELKRIPEYTYKRGLSEYIDLFGKEKFDDADYQAAVKILRVSNGDGINHKKNAQQVKKMLDSGALLFIALPHTFLDKLSKLAAYDALRVRQ